MGRGLVLLWALGGCVPDRCELVQALPADEVLAVGDSVLAWNHEAACQSVPDQLSLLRGARVDNRAVNGARLTGTEPIGEQVPAGSWEWAIVGGGANDLNQRCDCGDCEAVLADLSTFDGRAGAMPELVDELIAQGSQVALAGVYYPGDKAWYGFDRCEVALRSLRQRYLALAERRPEAVYVDLAAVIDPVEQPELFWIDHVHPNPEGALVIAEALAAAMEQGPTGEL